MRKAVLCFCILAMVRLADGATTETVLAALDRYVTAEHIVTMQVRSFRLIDSWTTVTAAQQSAFKTAFAEAWASASSKSDLRAIYLGLPENARPILRQAVREWLAIILAAKQRDVDDVTSAVESLR